MHYTSGHGVILLAQNNPSCSVEHTLESTAHNSPFRNGLRNPHRTSPTGIPSNAEHWIRGQDKSRELGRSAQTDGDWTEKSESSIPASVRLGQTAPYCPVICNIIYFHLPCGRPPPVYGPRTRKAPFLRAAQAAQPAHACHETSCFMVMVLLLRQNCQPPRAGVGCLRSPGMSSIYLQKGTS